jgi:hypothetical protein
MKSIVKLNTLFFPWELDHAGADLVGYYNTQRYHEALDNVTPEDVYRGRTQEVLTHRERLKQRTLQQRRDSPLSASGNAGFLTFKESLLFGLWSCPQEVDDIHPAIQCHIRYWLTQGILCDNSSTTETCRRQHRPVFDFVRSAVIAYRAGLPAPSLVPAASDY